MYYIYMLRCDDDSIYTGITTDIAKRVKEHFYKSDKAAKYTKTRNVVALEALWSCDNRSLASKLEYRLKHLPKIKKEEIITQPTIIEDEFYQVVSNYSLDVCLETE
ncbi:MULTISPECIES: GIY-YIG nuclease family protein [unclassified Breznakia]|uniref:GIY-YIG nuclease family protein n=1 Tax=unclassified Breznakia TaxID=2623764 RepID=UPI0024735BC1|nr:MULTISPECIES: GIY-YIG nuclease family protein [unclassified Breznakia]MDH6367224.1 putative endonuclease [Breznakia sp. PH1-1]MDH6404356.1 putative endonuclease [Breznakia sp. PF1-11]MDH6412065.1 putative endonuclease [Breznakia sp. PFB1-11]MDH6414344.1 putative endonuclease [Breznakia sp. PFB1-14]MDH6416726.1 putative endonuclease [Breznakia sp. PFB1-4]